MERHFATFLFDLNRKTFPAFGAIALMISHHTGQTDLRVAMGTHAVNVSFAVFPFVTAQKKPPFGFPYAEKIFSVFLRALVCLSGKHTVKHKNTDGE